MTEGLFRKDVTVNWRDPDKTPTTFQRVMSVYSPSADKPIFEIVRFDGSVLIPTDSVLSVEVADGASWGREG